MNFDGDFIFLFFISKILGYGFPSATWVSKLSQLFLLLGLVDGDCSNSYF